MSVSLQTPGIHLQEIIDEFVAVIKLANHYVVVHMQGSKSAFKSNFETDEKVAFASAKSFARENKITRLKNIQSLDRPIMTIIKQANGNWCPAKLHPDCVQAILGLNREGAQNCYVGNQDHAMNMARTLARAENLNFLPQIGIPVAHPQELLSPKIVV